MSVISIEDMVRTDGGNHVQNRLASVRTSRRANEDRKQHFEKFENRIKYPKKKQSQKTVCWSNS